MGQTPQWMDFSEIAILLALEANQPDQAHAKSANEILRMRRAGDGWPEIARALGCKNIDALIEAAGRPPRPLGGTRPSPLATSRPKGGRRNVA